MKTEENPPKDRYNLVFMIFYLMGIGNLMPWNFFMNVQDYWSYKFRDVSLDPRNGSSLERNSSFMVLGEMNGTNNTFFAKSVQDEEALTPLQLSWNSYMSIANMIPNLGMLLLNATIGHKIPMRPRLVVSLIGIIILFIVTDAMTRVNTDVFQNGFLVVTLGTVVLITACVGILQGGLAGLAGQFPPKYMGSLVQGQAVGGIITCVINILSIELSTDPTNSAFYCFLVASIFIVICTIAFVAMTKTTFYQYYAKKNESTPKQESTDHEEEDMIESLNNESSPIIRPPRPTTSDTIQNDRQIKDMAISSSCNNGSVEVEVNDSIPVSGPESSPLIVPVEENPPKTPTTTLFIVRKIWVWIVTVFITFTICLSIFPAVAVIVDSTEKGKGYTWNDKYFTPVACLLLFNIGDYIGRILASLCKWPQATPSGSIFILMFSVARLAFIPLFLFCNASPMNRHVTKVYFESDAVFMILIALLSISNGYIGNIVMMFGPKMLDRPEDQGRAASILVFFLVFGLSVGALLSKPLLYLL